MVKISGSGVMGTISIEQYLAAANASKRPADTEKCILDRIIAIKTFHDLI
jgi:hypothetical protein